MSRLSRQASTQVSLSRIHCFKKRWLNSSQQNEFSANFATTGIPQAMLVDQNGVIQLIRVGSGEKNALDIDVKIQELLGVH